MAVKGKKKYSVYLTEGNVEVVQQVLEIAKYKGGLSGYLDKLISASVGSLIASGVLIDKNTGVKFTPAKLLRLLIKSFRNGDIEF